MLAWIGLLDVERLSSCFPVSVLVAAAQNSSMPTVSKDGSISSSLVPPVSSTDLTTLGDVNESKPEVSTQVTRHKNDGQANRLFDQCHLPPRTPVAVSIFDTARIYKKKNCMVILDKRAKLWYALFALVRSSRWTFSCGWCQQGGELKAIKKRLPGGVTPIQCITNM